MWSPIWIVINPLEDIIKHVVFVVTQISGYARHARYSRQSLIKVDDVIFTFGFALNPHMPLVGCFVVAADYHCRIAFGNQQGAHEG